MLLQIQLINYTLKLLLEFLRLYILELRVPLLENKYVQLTNGYQNALKIHPLPMPVQPYLQA